MRPLMVLGCTSDAGKSLLVTALCRWFARHGVDVVPFKAQNMSNNARVVNGGEIGVAQWLQAKAARVEPTVDMNPVLLKPEADTQSQVVVRGRVDRRLTQTAWNDRHDALWTPMSESFDRLVDAHDLVIVEGAGSPAEINLRDQVNNRMIAHADAAGLLVSDIDRGGSFAHLYGTWALVPDSTRERLRGFVLNRFRGDPALLAPGPQRLVEMTGMADVGVLPMLRHELPREEGAVESSSAPPGAPSVVIPRLPFGSNLDEFHLLSTVAAVRWVEGPDALSDLDVARDLVVIPGSKHVAADLDWLRERGLADAIVEAASHGIRIVGVCGGAMMLGSSLSDPDGVEGSSPWARDGLGLVSTRTVLGGEKTVAATELDIFGGRFAGYEIRYGDLDDGVRVVEERNVLATTVHGLFEHPEVIERVLGVRPRQTLDDTFELLADAVDAHLDVELLGSLAD